VRFFPPEIILLFYIACIFLCIPNFTSGLINRLSRLTAFSVIQLFFKRLWLCILVICGFSFLLFWFLRQKYPFLGDGSMRVYDTVLEPSYGIIPLYHWSYLLLTKFIDIGGTTSLALINAVLGIFYVGIVLWLSDYLGRNRFEKICITAGMVSLAVIQIFFGYIEIYGFILIFIMLYILTAVISLQEKLSPVIPIVIIISSFYMHAVAMTLFPSALYLLWHRYKLYLVFHRYLLFKIFVILIVVVGGYWIGSNFIKGSALRLLPSEDFSYSLLSFSHLWEFVNGQLLASPVGWIIFSIGLSLIIYRRNSFTPFLWFFFIAGISQLGYAFLFNFQKGSADWDLMAVPGISYTIFGLLALFSLCKDEYSITSFRAFLAALLIIAVLQTGSFVIINATDRSIDRFVEIISTDPADSYRPLYQPPHLAIGNKFEEAGMIDLALEQFKLGAEKYKNSTLYNNLGAMYEKKNMPEKAEEAYFRAIELNPSYVKPYIKLGDMYLYKGEYDKALDFFLKAMELDSTNAIVYNNMGNIFFSKGDYERALELCLKADMLRPNDPDILFNLGGLYFRLDNYEKSIEAFRDAENLDSDNPALHFQLGSSYMFQGNYSEAAASFERALELNPGEPNILNNLGVVLHEIGEIERSIQTFYQVLKSNPVDSQTHYNLALALLSQKKYIQARQEAFLAQKYGTDATSLLEKIASDSLQSITE